MRLPAQKMGESRESKVKNGINLVAGRLFLSAVHPSATAASPHIHRERWYAAIPGGQVFGECQQTNATGIHSMNPARSSVARPVPVFIKMMRPDALNGPPVPCRATQLFQAFMAERLRSDHVLFFCSISQTWWNKTYLFRSFSKELIVRSLSARYAHVYNQFHSV